MRFHWSKPDRSSGGLYLQDELGGIVVNVDMAVDTSYTLTNTGISALKIVYGKTLTRTVAVTGGWNMVSVPLDAPDMSVGTVFPGASSQAYGYSGAYVVSPTLASGKGYWLKFPSGTSYNVTGALKAIKELPMVAGWQIIGPLETSVPVELTLDRALGYSPGELLWVHHRLSTASTLEVR